MESLVPMSQLARILAVLVIACLPFGVQAKSKEPIRLVAGTSVEQQIVTTIAARALRKAGFKYELVEFADPAALTALQEGGAHAHLTMPSTGALPDVLAAGGIVSLGGLGDNDPTAPVLKIVAKGMKKKWPYAQKLLKRMVLTPEELSALVGAVEGGTPMDQVAANWFKDNPKVWKPWIAAAKNWMKP